MFMWKNIFFVYDFILIIEMVVLFMKSIIEQQYKRIKRLLKQNGFEHRYLDKMMKNYREQDYGDASVGLGKILESFAKTILDDEKENDVLITLINSLYRKDIITEHDKSVLMSVRENRNDNAHGDEIYSEISRDDLEKDILKVFDFLEKELNEL